MSFLKRVISTVTEIGVAHAPEPHEPQQVSAPRRVLVVNSKGGCGKTTISTNLTGCIASRNHSVVLIDHDPQGSSIQWLASRSDEHNEVYGISAYSRPGAGKTRSFQMRIPEGTEYVVLDAPAGVCGADLIQLVRGVDAIIIPVLPSPIDIHACSHFIRDLLLVAKVRSRSIKIGVIANRTRAANKAYNSLIKFLKALDIEFIGALRDSQNYIHAAEDGLSVAELHEPSARKDKQQWNEILDWIDRT